MTKKFTRRKMIQGSGLLLGTNIIGLFTQSFLNGAFANTDVESYYLSMLMRGGPARWVFDLPLAPLDDQSIEFNPTTLTRVNSLTNLAEYHTTKIGNYHLPPMWAGKLATPGGSVQASELLNHMLNIRGVYGHSTNAHAPNIVLKYQLSSGAVSMHGSVADAKPPVSQDGIAYPALSINEMAFKSAKGLSLQSSSDASANFLIPLLDSFTSNANLSYSDITEGFIDQAIAAFAENLNTTNPNARISYTDRISAKSLFKRNFGNFIDAHTVIRHKYEDIMTRQITEAQLQLGQGIDQGSFLTKSDNGIPERYYLSLIHI